MNRSKLAVAPCLGLVVLLGTARESCAIGPGGTGFPTVGSYPTTISGLGPLDGDWSAAGVVDGFVSAINNPSPDAAGRGVNTSVSVGNIWLHLAKPTGLFQFYFNGGQFASPTMGLTSNYGVFNSVAPYGSAYNTTSPAVMSYWVTVQPSQYWSISAGKMAPLEGVEGAAIYLNPTFFVSDLNNMQVVSGYGPQLNLYYGPSTFNLQWSDADNTNRHNIVSAAFTYNLNADGSDYLLGFGHTNLGHTGNPGQNHKGVGLGFSEANSSLIGVGGQWLVGAWSIVPEIQYQWLPRNSVSSSTANPKPLTTYYNAAAMVDLTYKINNTWSVTAQPQYVYQNGDKHDPNAALFGNWLQYDSPAAPGTFTPGTSMLGLQGNVTWQHQNFYPTATIAYTHINGFGEGTGYGLQGHAADQVVGVLDVGYALGKY
jgi:hypothetical protein